MKTTWIRLNSVKQVEEFVNRCRKYDAELELSSGELVSNPKSLLGVLSLRLSEPLRLTVRGRAGGEEEILCDLQEYRNNLIED